MLSPKSVLLALGLLACFALATGCSSVGEYVVRGETAAAGVDGKITIEEVGGTSKVVVKLDHLPPPSRVGTGNTVFAVWFVPKSGTASKAGYLVYDVEDRVGTLTATTPETAIEVRVTAEKNKSAATPGPDTVVTKSVRVPQ